MNNFESKLEFNLGSVFSNETIEVDVFFTLLPTRDCVITAKAYKDGQVFHLNGMSSLFGAETDFFLHSPEISILASVTTDQNNNIIGGVSSGFQTIGGWTRYWWDQKVSAVK